MVIPLSQILRIVAFAGLRRLSGFPQFANLGHPAQAVRDHTSGVEQKHGQRRDKSLQNEACFHVPVFTHTVYYMKVERVRDKPRQHAMTSTLATVLPPSVG